MSGRLEKLSIRNEDTGETFSVLFNPTQYSIEDASKWTDQDRMGQKPELHYTGGERKKLSMELFFDTYESRTDVREHTSKIAGLLVFNREVHRPPKVTISWGQGAPGGPHADFPFTGVLLSLTQQFVLFLGDGTPVRAKLTCVFLEFTLPEEELQANEPNSPDHTKAYVVKEGDTLSGIAGVFYRDPRRWRPIARRNGIHNPRELPAGMVLTIPTLT
ncbi:MAG TPA: LysM peptidoglycan-binding domain-containing protein [Longimicrobiales bacterium]